MEQFSSPEFISFLWGVLVAALTYFIPFVVCMWRLNPLAGQPAWAAIVPIYNYVVLLKIIRKPWWWILLMLIPYIGIIWTIWSLNLFVKAFGKGAGYTIGIIFLPYIFFPILAFSSSTRFQGKMDVGMGEGTSLDQVF
jgi:hypothetical protein